MIIKKLTCIECPIGCEMEAGVEDGKAVYVKGNSCPRGKMYAENEVVCPKRVVTSTVRTTDSRMLPVKTDAPVKKSEQFDLMKKINAVRVSAPVKIGDIIVEKIDGNANLVATGNLD
jgi:CxxC motif-containing protein